ncbi:MAG: ribose-phosphate diphosphokinase [Nanoarchaeota archaeon]
MIITTLKNSEKLAKKISKEMKIPYMETESITFPDGDIYLKYKKDLTEKKLIIVESMQPNSNETLMRIIFAAKTAKDLGAKKVILIAPYLAFMRQDKRFNPGECVSAPIMAELLNNSIDQLITIDPHLHRIPKLSDIFTIKAKNYTANHVIADYIKKKFKNEIIVGPDWESYQWADDIAQEVGVKKTVLEKDRHSFRSVDVKIKDKIDMKGKNVIIVDDIISTGNTMIKAAQKARKLGAKTVTAIGVHGLFVENGLKKMHKHFDKILTVNTIEHETNIIDISPELVSAIKKELRI